MKFRDLAAILEDYYYPKKTSTPQGHTDFKILHPRFGKSLGMRSEMRNWVKWLRRTVNKKSAPISLDTEISDSFFNHQIMPKLREINLRLIKDGTQHKLGPKASKNNKKELNVLGKILKLIKDEKGEENFRQTLSKTPKLYNLFAFHQLHTALIRAETMMKDKKRATQKQLLRVQARNKGIEILKFLMDSNIKMPDPRYVKGYVDVAYRWFEKALKLGDETAGLLLYGLKGSTEHVSSLFTVDESVNDSFQAWQQFIQNFRDLHPAVYTNPTPHHKSKLPSRKKAHPSVAPLIALKKLKGVDPIEKKIPLHIAIAPNEVEFSKYYRTTLRAALFEVQEKAAATNQPTIVDHSYSEGTVNYKKLYRATASQADNNKTHQPDLQSSREAAVVGFRK